MAKPEWERMARAQSRKLQAVMSIPGVRERLAELDWEQDNPTEGWEFVRVTDGLSEGTFVAEIERVWPGSFWHLAKGRARADEPLFGFQVLFGTDEVLAEGDGASPAEAISAAIDKAGRAALAREDR